MGWCLKGLESGGTVSEGSDDSGGMVLEGTPSGL